MSLFAVIITSEPSAQNIWCEIYALNDFFQWTRYNYILYSVTITVNSLSIAKKLAYLIKFKVVLIKVN